MSKRRRAKKKVRRVHGESDQVKDKLKFGNAWACELCWWEGRYVEFKFPMAMNRAFTTNRMMLTCPICNMKAPVSLSRYDEEDDEIHGVNPLWRPTYLPGVLQYANANLEIVKLGDPKRDARLYLRARKQSNDYSVKRHLYNQKRIERAKRRTKNP